MKRRNYIQSVASLPLLSTSSLPSTSEPDEEDSEFKLHSVWHRGNEKGRVVTPAYSYEYSSYDEWQASSVVSASLHSFDITPFYFDGVRLISSNISSNKSVLISKSDTDIRIVVEDDYFYLEAYEPDSEDVDSFYCGSVRAVKNTIQEVI